MASRRSRPQSELTSSVDALDLLQDLERVNVKNPDISRKCVWDGQNQV